MASEWAKSLTRVTVDLADTPKPVTFIYPYYENQRFFWDQVTAWSLYPAPLRAHLSAIVVDDGSPVPAQLPQPVPFPIRLFRIGVDVRWNWLAARNIGAHHAPDGWMLLTDMDHAVPIQTAHRLVWGHHDPDVVYVFSRREHTGRALEPHSASFFMTRALFWMIGGYDERLSGYYGTDGEFRRRIMEYAQMVRLSDELIRYEFVEDSSTTRYLRKQPEDIAVRRIIAGREKNWRPKVLSFPYREVTSC